MSVAFEARDVSKSYRTTRALAGVSLTIQAGELVGLIGPNGAGKSTLVKIACGLVRPSSGEVEICGAPAGSDVARASLGYLAELFRFPGWLRADEVLELHQELAGSKGGAPERRDLLEIVGLGEVAGRRVEAMSKGMQQRLGIAQALVGAPRLLMLDEPTSALDPEGRRVVRDILREVRARGIGVLLNSHLLSEVELVCDRVVILSGGRVITERSPQDFHAAGVEIETDAGMRTYRAARRNEIPKLVRELVESGERIYSIRSLRPTLEEVYLEAVEEEHS
jgi:ABC-2 type transport system ATP-binding protein